MDRDLEEELANCPWFLEKVRASKTYAQNLYAALCNMRWQPVEVMSILKDEYWTCSWRSAGGVVANLRQEGDYMSWYCSGIGGGYSADDKIPNGYVTEGTVTDEIREDLLKLGWQPSEWPDD